MKTLLILLVSIVLVGCSAKSQWGEADTGGAVYNYTHTTGNDSCSINGTSAREVSGVDIEIQADCSMKIITNNSTPVGDAFGAINGLVERLPILQPVQ